MIYRKIAVTLCIIILLSVFSGGICAADFTG